MRGRGVKSDVIKKEEEDMCANCVGFECGIPRMTLSTAS